jgi:formylglycine-generating enzyme required for sulfatase activity
VGSFRANLYGLYDTAGNVSEWVQDCYQDGNQNPPFDGRPWDDENGCESRGRVIRGGSWFGEPEFLRSASRDRNFPDTRYSYLGFRLAQD